MVEKMRIVSAAKGLFDVFGYSRKAIEKIRAGNYREGLDEVAGAAYVTMKSWGDFKYAWNMLANAADSLHMPKQTAIVAAQSQAERSGYFTGSWRASDRQQVELLYHDYETNVLLLFSRRKDGNGNNEYKGAVYVEEGVLLWTGYNHLGKELAIIGVPDDEGHNISCHTWGQHPQTGELILAEQFVLSRM